MHAQENITSWKYTRKIKEVRINPTLQKNGTNKENDIPSDNYNNLYL